MSFLNNSNKTVDGENTFIGDVFNCNGDFEVQGFKGSANQFLKKSATNILEWANLVIGDLLTAGYCIDLSGSTIAVDLSELTTGTGATITDYIPIIRITNGTHTEEKHLISDLEGLLTTNLAGTGLSYNIITEKIDFKADWYNDYFEFFNPATIDPDPDYDEIYFLVNDTNVSNTTIRNCPASTVARMPYFDNRSSDNNIGFFNLPTDPLKRFFGQGENRAPFVSATWGYNGPATFDPYNWRLNYLVSTGCRLCPVDTVTITSLNSQIMLGNYAEYAPEGINLIWEYKQRTLQTLFDTFHLLNSATIANSDFLFFTNSSNIMKKTTLTDVVTHLHGAIGVTAPITNTAGVIGIANHRNPTITQKAQFGSNSDSFTQPLEIYGDTNVTADMNSTQTFLQVVIDNLNGNKYRSFAINNPAYRIFAVIGQKLSSGSEGYVRTFDTNDTNIIEVDCNARKETRRTRWSGSVLKWSEEFFSTSGNGTKPYKVFYGVGTGINSNKFFELSNENNGAFDTSLFRIYNPGTADDKFLEIDSRSGTFEIIGENAGTNHSQIKIGRGNGSSGGYVWFQSLSNNTIFEIDEAGKIRINKSGDGTRYIEFDNTASTFAAYETSRGNGAKFFEIQSEDHQVEFNYYNSTTTTNTPVFSFDGFAGLTEFKDKGGNTCFKINHTKTNGDIGLFNIKPASLQTGNAGATSGDLYKVSDGAGDWTLKIKG